MNLFVHPTRLLAASFAAVFVYIAVSWFALAGPAGLDAVGWILVAAAAYSFVCFLRQLAVWRKFRQVGELTICAHESPQHSALARFYTFTNAHPVPTVHCETETALVRISGALFRAPDLETWSCAHEQLVEVASETAESSTVLRTLHCGQLSTSLKDETAALVVLYSAPDGTFVLELRAKSGRGYWLRFADETSARARMGKETSGSA